MAFYLYFIEFESTAPIPIQFDESEFASGNSFKAEMLRNPHPGEPHPLQTLEGDRERASSDPLTLAKHLFPGRILDLLARSFWHLSSWSPSLTIKKTTDLLIFL